MGSDAGACGGPGGRLRAAFVIAVAAVGLLAAPNALAGLYIVNSTLDTGGACVPSSCTLRQAITAADGAPGSTITFQFGIGGSNTISPASPLPDVTAPTTIDATTQPGYAGAPLVKLNGSAAGAGANGFNVFAKSAVKGLSIVNFGGRAIALNAGSDGPHRHRRVRAEHHRRLERRRAQRGLGQLDERHRDRVRDRHPGLRQLHRH
jgi:hypothetical protein